jgi:hypothetical protein
MPLASLDEGAYNKLVAAQDGYVLLDQKTVAYWRPPPRPIDPGSITDHASAGGHTWAVRRVRWTIPGQVDQLLEPCGTRKITADLHICLKSTGWS